jgi:cytochrome b6-f complex iron-sulfur subunit
MTAGLASFGAAVLGFLWYAAKGGFGGRINAGNLNDIKAGIEANDGFYYVPEARSWITAYPADALPNAERVYPPPVLTAMQAGIAVLYQKCPHLGCRVPQCVSSQWFECPCHGSQYNQAGEKKAGPAPRGMDRFGVAIASGNVTIDTGIIFQGPPIGTNTTGQEAEGPHCITGGAEGEH